MITFVLILLALIVVVGLFVPDKYLPKKRPRKPRRRYSEPHGLPWMDPNYQKRKKREERDSSKLGF